MKKFFMCILFVLMFSASCFASFEVMFTKVFYDDTANCMKAVVKNNLQVKQFYLVKVIDENTSSVVYSTALENIEANQTLNLNFTSVNLDKTYLFELYIFAHEMYLSDYVHYKPIWYTERTDAKIHDITHESKNELLVTVRNDGGGGYFRIRLLDKVTSEQIYITNKMYANYMETINNCLPVTKPSIAVIESSNLGDNIWYETDSREVYPLFAKCVVDSYKFESEYYFTVTIRNISGFSGNVVLYFEDFVTGNIFYTSSSVYLSPLTILEQTIPSHDKFYINVYSDGDRTDRILIDKTNSIKLQSYSFPNSAEVTYNVLNSGIQCEVRTEVVDYYTDEVLYDSGKYAITEGSLLGFQCDAPDKFIINVYTIVGGSERRTDSKIISRSPIIVK